MLKHIVSALWAAIVPLLFWLGGFNFDERGPTAMLCCSFTIAVYCAVINYPGWGDD